VVAGKQGVGCCNEPLNSIFATSQREDLMAQFNTIHCPFRHALQEQETQDLLI
jgi:hypothetical protein